MNRPSPLRRGPEPAASERTRLVRHMSSPDTSYAGFGVKVNPPLRVRVRNLSATRPPSTESDVRLWPTWSDVSARPLPLDLGGYS
jgi:hypothetical protein